MKNTEQKTKIVSIILLIQTIIWLIFTIISMSQVQQNWNKIDYIKWVAHPDIFFILNYINATLLTITAVVMYTYIHVYLKEKNATNSLVGFIFIPIYAVLNLICYSIQISIVPELCRNALENQYFMISELIQANNQSIIGYLNGFAYAVLGIPSIIFGYGIFRLGKKLSGITLFANGIFCIIGIIGIIINNSVLSKGALIGGVLFLISLVFISIEFGKIKNKKDI